jgi:RimJ/RimL family protein N-acetyltransferase
VTELGAAPAFELLTDDPTVSLRELNAAQADEYYALINRNRAHLTQFGNYEDEGRATLKWVKSLLARPAAGLRFGIWYAGALVGQAELAHKLRTSFTVAYWLGSEHVGRGLMTKAIFRLMQHARERFGATAFFAGVTHGNAKSAAVLLALGYEIAIDHAHHTVFVRSN